MRTTKNQTKEISWNKKRKNDRIENWKFLGITDKNIDGKVKEQIKKKRRRNIWK